MIKVRIERWITALRNGFWFVPLCLLLVGVALGFAGTTFDRWLTDRALTSPFGSAASPGGARAVLSVAAGALATTLAISLSLTMVTVQLASSQFTPRLMRRFLADRFMQAVVGAFLGSISYAFIILRAVRSPDEGSPFVPLVSLSFAVVLTLGCLALLVVFLHRTMRTMQASTLIEVVGYDTVRTLRGQSSADFEAAPPAPGGPCLVVRATDPGYVQRVDDEGIMRELAAHPIGLIWRDAGPGTFVIVGEPLVTLYGIDALPDDELACVREQFTTGGERTYESDIGFGVRHLVDMALKALSPGINDVTSAVMVVNELGVVARHVCEQCVPDDGWRRLPREAGPAYVVRVLDLDTYLDLAFGEIALAAITLPRVHVRILELLAALAHDRSQAVRRVLAHHAARVRAMLAPNQPTDRDVPIAVRQRLLRIDPATDS